MNNNFPQINMSVTGRRLRWIMRGKGFSVKELQDYLKPSSPQSIYHWFEGKSIPSVDNLYAMSDLFGVPVDYMLCGSGKEGRTERAYTIQRLKKYQIGLSLMLAG